MEDEVLEDTIWEEAKTVGRATKKDFFEVNSGAIPSKASISRGK